MDVGFIYLFTCDFSIHIDPSNWPDPFNNVANTTRLGDICSICKNIYILISYVYIYIYIYGKRKIIPPIP